MKQFFIALLTVLVLLPASGAAQYKGEWNAFISLGPSIPLEPNEFRQYWNTGFNVGGGVGFGVSTVLRALISVRYHDHKLDGVNLEDAVIRSGNFDVEAVGEGGRLSNFTFQGHLKYVPWPSDNALQPYFIVGAGYMHQEIRELDYVANGQQRTWRGRTENAMVGTISLGAEIPVWENASLFGELGWASANTERQMQFLPYHFGIMVKL